MSEWKALKLERRRFGDGGNWPIIDRSGTRLLSPSTSSHSRDMQEHLLIELYRICLVRISNIFQVKKNA